MINIKSSLFYAALAACLGTGYGAHSLMSYDRASLELRSVECEDMGKPKFDKTPRPLSSGESF